ACASWARVPRKLTRILLERLRQGLSRMNQALAKLVVAVVDERAPGPGGVALEGGEGAHQLSELQQTMLFDERGPRFQEFGHVALQDFVERSMQLAGALGNGLG